MKRIVYQFFTLLTAVLVFQAGNAQPLFERGFGTAADDEAYALCKTTSGGYAVAGYTKGYIAGTKQPYVVKFDINGHVEWSTYLPVNVNMTATGIVDDGSGNLYVCSTTGEGAPNSDSIMISKLNSQGTLIWSTLHGDSTYRTASELVLLPSGDILISGAVERGAPLKAVGAITKVDPNGNVLLEKTYSMSTAISFTDITATYDGNFIVCAMYKSGNAHSAYLVKVDSNADSVWTRTHLLVNTSNPQACDVMAVCEMENHDIVIGGNRFVGIQYNRAFFMRLDETCTTVINTSNSSALADGVSDIARAKQYGNDAFATNNYYNWGSHFAMIHYDDQTFSVSPNFQYFNLSAFSFDFDYNMRGPARAIIDDTDTTMYQINMVIVGNTRFSGYGGVDIAIVKTDEVFQTSSHPSITNTGPDTLCPGDSTLLILNGPVYAFHHWANVKSTVSNYNLGVSSDSIWVKDAGLYVCIVFDSDSNIYLSNIIEINKYNPSVTISNLSPLNFCAADGDSVILKASTNFPSASFQWYINGTPISGATNDSLTVTLNGTYYCMVNSSCGIFQSNSKTVVANDGLIVYPALILSVVQTNCVVPFGWSSAPNTHYRWYKDAPLTLLPDTTNLIYPDPGPYIGVAYNGCTTDSMYFTAGDGTYLNANGSPNYYDCSGSGILLQVLGNPYVQNVTWEYNGNLIPGANTDFYMATTPGTYTAFFEDIACPGNINSQYLNVISVSALPNVNITASSPVICNGAPITLSAPVLSAKYRWYRNGSLITVNDSINPTITSAGNYYLRLDNPCGTVFSNTITITSNNMAVFLTGSACAAECNGIINANITNGTLPLQYVWNTGATTANITNVCNGNYTLTVTNGSNCVASGTISLNQPALMLDSLVNPPVCGYCNGSINYILLSGTGPLQYLWNTGATTNSLTGVCENQAWSMSVTDNNNCSFASSGIFPATCDSVWPGDADDNGVVENFDLFPIGVHFGETGPTRNNASILWTGQPASLWGVQQANGKDIKYVDTDGNGTIDADDTLAVNVNFNQMHSPFGPPVSIDPDITVILPNDTVFVGSTVNIQLVLGGPSNQIQDIYGIAYMVEYDGFLTTPGSENMATQNWFTNGTYSLELLKQDASASKFFVSGVRTVHTDTIGYGLLSSFTCDMIPTMPSGTNGYAVYDLVVSDIHIIDRFGAVTMLNSLDTTFLVTDIPTGIISHDQIQFSVYPNPTTGLINVLATAEAQAVITDQTGRVCKILTILRGANTIDIGNFDNGNYFLQSEKGNKQLKVVLIK